MANRSLSARSRGGAFQALAPKPRTASTHLGAQLKQLRLLQGPDCAHEAVGLARRLELRERVRVGGPGYGSVQHHDGWQRGIFAHTSETTLVSSRIIGTDRRSIEMRRFAHRLALRQSKLHATERREALVYRACQIDARRGLCGERRTQSAPRLLLHGVAVFGLPDAQALLHVSVEVGNRKYWPLQSTLS